MTANAEDARAALDASLLAGVHVLVPATVLVESLYGDERDARVNRVLKSLKVVPLTEEIAREAAGLKHAAGVQGVEASIDATVVAVASLLGGGAILTSDPDDIGALASARSDLHIRAIAV